MKQQYDLVEKLKFDYNQQYQSLIETNENIRLLKNQLEQQEHLKNELIINYQNQIKTIQNEFEEKLLLLNKINYCESNNLLKYDNELIQMKINEEKYSLKASLIFR